MTARLIAFVEGLLLYIDHEVDEEGADLDQALQNFLTVLGSCRIGRYRILQALEHLEKLTFGHLVNFGAFVED